MELSPKAITSVEFHLVRKGYDPDEVRAFLASLAKGVEAMQTQLANADARARAAVQRMQEVSAQSGSAAPTPATTPVAPAPVVAAPEPAAPVVTAAAATSLTLEAEQAQADTIARTLLLAQRTADATISDANERSRTIVAAAEERGRGVIDEAESRAAQIVRSAEERSAQMVDKAKADATQAHAGERARIESEVAALTAQRGELHRHIDILGGHVVDQRTRLSSAAEALRSILDSPSGLQAIASPLPSSPTTSGSSGAGGPGSTNAPTAANAPISANAPVAAHVSDPSASTAEASNIFSAGASSSEPLTIEPAAEHVAPSTTVPAAPTVPAPSPDVLPGMDKAADATSEFNDVRWAPETDQA